jgi:glucokinase
VRIGVDIGGTKVLAGLVNEEGAILRKARIPTERERGYGGVRENILLLLQSLIGEAGLTGGEIGRIGIACAGQIDKESRRILFSPNLDWRDVPLRDDIERATGIETTIENDVNAATYGEWKFALSAAPSTLIGIFIGTGVGGGLIIDGKLFRGAWHVGAEVGHIVVNPHGYKCHCGGRGCLEAYCGGRYILGRVRAAMGEGYRGKIWGLIDGDTGALQAGHVEQAAYLGDELCSVLWEENIEYLGSAVAGLVNLLNPEVVLFGGGVVYGTEHLIERAREVVDRRAMAACLKNLTIEKARHGEDAAILGAAFSEE